MLLRAAALLWAAFGFACRDPLPTLSPAPQGWAGPPLLASLDHHAAAPPLLAATPSLEPPTAASVQAIVPSAPSREEASEADDGEEPVGPKPRAPARPKAVRKQKAPVIGQLNLNRATEAELRLLPGIGKGRARAIVERRQQRPFASLEEVERLRGLKSIVRRLRPHLTLAGNTTLRPAPTLPEP